MQVQIDTLEQMLEVENAITTPFENLDLVVEPFDEATVLALDEVVGNFLPPSIQQFQKIIIAIQAAFSNLLDPG